MSSIQGEPLKKKRKSKWDQPAPGHNTKPRTPFISSTSTSTTSSHQSCDASVSAAAAVARLNAMLEAQGKLSRNRVRIVVSFDRIYTCTCI